MSDRYDPDFRYGRQNHVQGHHNGDCIYCNGFDYGDAWWNERCEERVKFERWQVLGKPAAIRAKISQLQEELKQAELEAAKVR